MFAFQKLDVYQYAIQFLGRMLPVVRWLHRDDRLLGAQLRQAALSIPLCISQGSGTSGKEARRFYALARRLALECAAKPMLMGSNTSKCSSTDPDVTPTMAT